MSSTTTSDLSLEERIERIKNSIDRINKLMQELKGVQDDKLERAGERREERKSPEEDYITAKRGEKVFRVYRGGK